MSTSAQRRRSRVAELAEAEADAVEAAEAETTESAPEAIEAESEAVADLEAEAAQLSIEKALRRFERENERHAHELARIMGPDFEAFAECIGCQGVGFAPVSGVQFDPDLEKCERCQGHGQMLTGAVNEMNVVRDCLACGGRGYTEKIVVPVVQAPVAGELPRFDPYTGQPLDATPPNPPPSQNGPWAPGYVPPGRPAS